MTSDLSFWTSPGAGGLGAVLAAVLLGLVALYNSHVQKQAAANALKQLQEEHDKQVEAAKSTLSEAAESRVSQERHQALERWWTQYIWLTKEGAGLDLETRFRVAVALTNEAERRKSKQLVELAQSYTIGIRVSILQQGREG